MSDTKFKLIEGGASNPFAVKASTAVTPEQAKQREALFKDVVRLLQDLEKTPDYDQKMDTVLVLESKILLPLFEEFMSVAPNLDKATIGVKFSGVLKHIAGLVMARRSEQLNADVDPSSPKFQLVFTWFLEIIREVMRSEGFDQLSIDRFFNSMSQRLAGWEDRCRKQLKGLTVKDLKTIRNPLLSS